MLAKQRSDIAKILNDIPLESRVTISGWIRTARISKNVGFVQVNDGSCFQSLQLIFDTNRFDISGLLTGACIMATGIVQKSPGKGQERELQVESMQVIGKVDGSYPLQKKRHSFEFLRTIPHLRSRTNTFLAVFRMRNALAYAIHEFFQSRGFSYFHAPLITGSDCEGAGQMFRVTTLDPTKGGKWEDDYFHKPVYLTVSGQLEGESFALALGKIYTFGPTFRADPSDTPRHAAEFWMIEPEMAFYDLEDNIELIEEFVKSITMKVMQVCGQEIEFLQNNYEPELKKRYETILENQFGRINFHDAIELLLRYKEKFTVTPRHDEDLHAEHERILTDEIFKRPVFVTNYPKIFKPFYMRVNDDNETVAALDLLVPGIGEIISGSQREERVDVLERRISELGMERKSYEWYLETRRWGSAPHSGFGLGFERMLMYLSGMKNIRDVLPYPRTYGQMEI